MAQTYFYPHTEHSETITLIEADFLVRDGQAFVAGTHTLSASASYSPSDGAGIELRYDADHKCYRRISTGQKVKSACVVELRPDKSIWAWGIE